MLELILNSGNKQGKADIKVPVSKLLCKVSMQFADGDALNAHRALYDINYPILLESLMPNSFKVEIIKYLAHGGSTTLVNSMTVAHLAELAANNEGFIESRYNLPDLTLQIRFSIELTNVGAIAADNNQFVTASFTDFPGIQSGNQTTFEVRSVGAPISTDVHLVYKPVACQAGGENRIDVGSAYAIALPSTMSNIDIQYASGENVKLKGEELEAVAIDVNDIVLIHDGRSTPFINWRVIPVELAERVAVTLNTSGNVYLLINEHL